MGISLKLACVWFFMLCTLKKKKGRPTKKLLQAELRMLSSGRGVGRSSWCLSRAGQHVFTPDLDGETVAKASSMAVGF